MTMTKRLSQTNAASQGDSQQTFLDHIRELQLRLFYIAIAFVAMGGISYVFFGQIADFVTKPIGDQELVYLTPAGAFSFMIQVCMYAGFIGALPVIMYQVYRFIMPMMPNANTRKILGFTAASFALAVCGVVFAYVVSLPASLYFLTNFNLHSINPMLTIDSYFSFVMTYLLAGAILFQLPILMLTLNSVRPLTPKKLMTYQRHMIVGSLIFAAVISPTPDVMNQLLLASPLVLMYQFGIGLVWITNRRQAHKLRSMDIKHETDRPLVGYDHLKSSTAIEQPHSLLRPSVRAKNIDGIVAYPKRVATHAPIRQTRKPLRRLVHQSRSIDGIMMPVRATAYGHTQ